MLADTIAMTKQSFAVAACLFLSTNAVIINYWYQNRTAMSKVPVDVNGQLQESFVDSISQVVLPESTVVNVNAKDSWPILEDFPNLVPSLTPSSDAAETLRTSVEMNYEKEDVGSSKCWFEGLLGSEPIIEKSNFERWINSDSFPVIDVDLRYFQEAIGILTEKVMKAYEDPAGTFSIIKQTYVNAINEVLLSEQNSRSLSGVTLLHVQLFAAPLAMVFIAYTLVAGLIFLIKRLTKGCYA